MTTKLRFLPDDHHFAIANVAVRSSQLDHHIEATIDALLHDAHHTAHFVLHNLGTDRLVDLLGALLKDRFPKDHKTIETLISEIKKARRARNDFLHQIWGPMDAEGFAMRASFRPHREETFFPTTAEEIQKGADALMQCTKALIGWHNLYIEERKRTP
jgi:hypothetical protein